MKEINIGRPTFDVVKENGKLHLYAGAILGITIGTEFAVYSSKVSAISSTFLGNFIVDGVGATTSSLKCTPAEIASIEHNTAVASPTTHFQSEFIVHVSDDSIRTCVEVAITEENPEDQYGRPQISADGSADNADLILRLRDNEISFSHRPSSEVGKFGLDRLCFTVPQHSSGIRRVLRAAAHFFKYLRHEPSEKLFQSKVKVYLREFEYTGKYENRSNGLFPVIQLKDRLKQGNLGEVEVIAVETGANLTTAPKYGIEVVNEDQNTDLFAWAVFFDCSTLEISEC